MARKNLDSSRRHDHTFMHGERSHANAKIKPNRWRLRLNIVCRVRLPKQRQKVEKGEIIIKSFFVRNERQSREPN